MEGTKSGFETTSFSSDKKIYFNYYSEEYIENLLKENGLRINNIFKQNYPETDGSFTVDIFITAEKCDDVQTA